MAAVPSGLATNSPRSDFISATNWSEPRARDRFGGLSGIEILGNGAKFLAISDQGTIWTGDLARIDGTITAIENTQFAALKDSKGNDLTKWLVDAEGLAVGPRGEHYISFEATHRVSRFAKPGATAELLPSHPDFKTLQNNSGLEALAIDAKGHLYTLPERSGKVDRPFPVYRFDGRKWSTAFTVPRRAPYLPVGADFGPDGRFYLLERHFSGILGFQARVRRFTTKGNALVNEELILETSLGTHGNLEGISVWRTPEGALRMTMIADDNFKSFLPTEIVEYAVTE